MSANDVRLGHGPPCQAGEEHSDQRVHEPMHRLLSRLGEAERRWYAAVEAIGYLQATPTQADLTVRATRHDGTYQTGESVSDAGMATLNLTKHDVCPTWNYTLCPRSTTVPDSALDRLSWELVL